MRSPHENRETSVCVFVCCVRARARVRSLPLSLSLSPTQNIKAAFKARTCRSWHGGSSGQLQPPDPHTSRQKSSRSWSELSYRRAEAKPGLTARLLSSFTLFFYPLWKHHRFLFFGPNVIFGLICLRVLIIKLMKRSKLLWFSCLLQLWSEGTEPEAPFYTRDTHTHTHISAISTWWKKDASLVNSDRGSDGNHGINFISRRRAGRPRHHLFRCYHSLSFPPWS